MEGARKRHKEYERLFEDFLKIYAEPQESKELIQSHQDSFQALLNYEESKTIEDKVISKASSMIVEAFESNLGCVPIVYSSSFIEEVECQVSDDGPSHSRSTTSLRFSQSHGAFARITGEMRMDLGAGIFARGVFRINYDGVLGKSLVDVTESDTLEAIMHEKTHGYSTPGFSIESLKTDTRFGIVFPFLDSYVKNAVSKDCLKDEFK